MAATLRVPHLLRPVCRYFCGRAFPFGMCGGRMAADVRRARRAPAHQACVWGCPCWAGKRPCYTPNASSCLPHGPSPAVRALARRAGPPTQRACAQGGPAEARDGRPGAPRPGRGGAARGPGGGAAGGDAPAAAPDRRAAGARASRGVPAPCRCGVPRALAVWQRAAVLACVRAHCGVTAACSRQEGAWRGGPVGAARARPNSVTLSSRKLTARWGPQASAAAQAAAWAAAEAALCERAEAAEARAAAAGALPPARSAG